MKTVRKLCAFATIAIASQTQAAVDVTGFTIEEASRPYGLIVMTLILVALGVASLKRGA